jgi:hypothetical protein
MFLSWKKRVGGRFSILSKNKNQSHLISLSKVSWACATPLRARAAPLRPRCGPGGPAALFTQTQCIAGDCRAKATSVEDGPTLRHPSHPPLIGSNAVLLSFSHIFENGMKGGGVRVGGVGIAAASGGGFMTPTNFRGLSVRGTTGEIQVEY